MKQKMIELQNDEQLVEITDLAKKVNQLMKDRDIDRKQIQELTFVVHHLKNEFRRVMEFEEVTKKLNDLISSRIIMNELRKIDYFKGQSSRTQVEYQPEDKKENKMNLKFSFHKDKVPEGAVNLMPKSTSGCSFGENNQFQHHVPDGYDAPAKQMTDIENSPLHTASKKHQTGPPHISNGPLSLATKTRLCNKFNTVEGCKYGIKCHYAHRDGELGQLHQFAPTMSSAMGFGGHFEPPPAPSLGPVASFGASATAKISVDASLAGAIIGKGGANTKQIYRTTGAKFFIQEHERDPNLKNIEFEGTFDQIKKAAMMVHDLIVNINTPAPYPMNPATSLGAGEFGAGCGNSSGYGAVGGNCGGYGVSGGNGSGFGDVGGSYNNLGASGNGYGGYGNGSYLKTRLCDHFNRGICTFGDKCHFAHGVSELRKAG